MKYDVVIIGAGHNGLIASCYLAKAGLKVAVLESTDSVGGASVSQRVFPDFDARLSRYSYLVSLMPDQIFKDLELSFTTLGRTISSYTPELVDGKDVGLLVHRQPGAETISSFNALAGESAFPAWQSFYDSVQKIATAVAPTMLQQLPTRSELKALVNDPIWDEIVELPMGQSLEKRFANDLIRGVVLTDGLIGTFSDAHDIAANRCFIYHLIGNGTGEWRVPRGGMGGLVSELLEKATGLGVEILTNHEVTGVTQLSSGWQTSAAGTTLESRFVLAACAPQVLAKIMGITPPASLDGSQVKINMLLKKLPRLKSGIDPAIAFAGTFHFDERYSDLQLAFKQSAAGVVPDRIPAEMYCHTLTDNTILSDELNAQGYHTLTLFGIHTPAALFDKNEAAVKQEIVQKLFAQLNRYLIDPIEECFAVAKDGSLCFEIKSPLELEKEIGLPRGNIFHKDLSMPFREDDQAPSWGVETEFPGLFIAGAGAIRGGGVSGIPGHNAARAVLDALG
ncbi:MAG: NAD(P)-binding protein [Actinobacteria bacterium]|uniref:Pyridine nucleotide-disulfide oxidoreductase domain-containing protein 2 n=1 Tax=freshwater metagenome TaxID=449393 RepID=A0A6J6FB20_9ZZZZ|nr:NAD(P)-binding protein [Actinomycetota bacterium]